MAVRHLPIGEPHPDAPQNIATPAFGVWFWFKAGIGFTLGAGAVAIAWWIVWVFLIINVPGLWLARGLSRF